jgi:hypothetical protein
MTIAIVGGAVANKYLNGGAVWTRLSWALGMQKLGFDVYFLEQIDRDSCVDASGAITGFEDCQNLKYFKKIMKKFGLDKSAALIYQNGEKIDGMSRHELADLISDADLMINITGHLCLPSIKKCKARKIYIDLDPGFTQFWHEAGLLNGQLDWHDFFFTIGEAIGTPGCSIPTGDIPWRTTRQPVVLDHWPFVSRGNPDRFTTVAGWRDAYGPVEYGGQTFGLKVHQFRRFMNLPKSIPQSCEIALDIHSADNRDLDLLYKNGWVIKDPRQLVPDPDMFRSYVQNSGAEFSVAKSTYVDTHSAWFSDRSVRYLASGKPVLIQDTGFSHVYPVGEGLLAFNTMEEAIAGAKSISENYASHCRAARSLAETWFDSDKVLAAMLDQIDGPY